MKLLKVLSFIVKSVSFSAANFVCCDHTGDSIAIHHRSFDCVRSTEMRQKKSNESARKGGLGSRNTLFLGSVQMKMQLRGCGKMPHSVQCARWVLRGLMVVSIWCVKNATRIFATSVAQSCPIHSMALITVGKRETNLILKSTESTSLHWCYSKCPILFWEVVQVIMKGLAVFVRIIH
mmetsp:Transcript_18540/g.25506  ORF Transcript_18540/g.25506 Transcript_18540/m.25506 type:complete len:178 (+) Transcript_18540:1136-1669(+)